MDLIGRQIGNYVVRQRIGGGGMGTVYLCEHPLLGRRAALKVLHPELATDDAVVERFFHEAKAVNEIGHEHIVDVLDFGHVRIEGRDVVYLLMELLDGESLAARLRRGRLPQATALAIMQQCCAALEASHKKSIVHRDLKPENIYLCRRGDDPDFVKIVDFGIAKLMADPSASHTRTGMVLGTPQYMSPEQCEGRGHVDHRADIYSLGVVLFEVLTGRVPFDDEGVGDVIVAHMTRPPPRPSALDRNLSPALESVVLRALEKDPARRFQSMAELSAALADPEQHLSNYQELPRAATISAPQAAILAATTPPHGTPTVPMLTQANTLSGATGELARRPHRVAPILATVFGVLALAGLAASFGLGLALRAQKHLPPPQPVHVVTPTRAQPIHLTFVTDPPGAMVLRPETGLLIGLTPLSLDVPPGSPAFSVELRQPGYQSVRRLVSTDESRELVVHMSKEITPPSPPAKTKSKPRIPKRNETLLAPRF